MIPVDPSLPQDMRDLLIRLDQRCSDGFEAINKRFDSVDRRTDGIDHRLTAIERDTADRPILKDQHLKMMARVDDLETWRDTTTSEIRGALKMAGWMKYAVGVIAAGLAYVGYQVTISPAPQTMQTKTVQTTTLPAPHD